MPAGNVVFQVEYEPSVVKVETPTNGTVTVDAGGAKAFTVPGEWNGDNTAVTAADMPSDFTAVAGNAAVAITVPGAASDILIYGISNDKFQIINLKDGVYSSNGVCGKNNVYQYAQQGKKIYYTVVSDVTATVAGTAATITDASTIEGVKKDQTVTLNAKQGYKFRKVEAKEGAASAEPVTYTELNGGEVLHPGDILDIADENATYSVNSGYFLRKKYSPYTVMRANITGSESYPTITPADDGAYYVLQDKDGDYYFYYKNLPATATSDGISVTLNSVDGNYKYFTFTVHEP